jgi:hypothetical protein
MRAGFGKHLRQRMVAAAVLAICASAAGWLVLSADRARFSAAPYSHIRRGMSEGDVVALLGAPPTNIRPLPEWVTYRILDWEGPQGRISLWCDKATGRMKWGAYAVPTNRCGQPSTVDDSNWLSRAKDNWCLILNDWLGDSHWAGRICDPNRCDSPPHFCIYVKPEQIP